MRTPPLVARMSKKRLIPGIHSHHKDSKKVLEPYLTPNYQIKYPLLYKGNIGGKYGLSVLPHPSLSSLVCLVFNSFHHRPSPPSRLFFSPRTRGHCPQEIQISDRKYPWIFTWWEYVINIIVFHHLYHLQLVWCVSYNLECQSMFKSCHKCIFFPQEIFSRCRASAGSNK